MAIFAGAVSLNPSRHPVPRDLVARMAGSLSRSPGDEPRVIASDAIALVAVDFAVLPGAGMRGDISYFTACSGDSLPEVDGKTLRRPASIDWLHTNLATRGSAALASARGDFSGVHWRASHGCALLFTDKLALRPLFYSVQPHSVLFASARRILESLPGVAQGGDLNGCAELASLGFALEGRTAHRGIQMLEPGRCLRIERGGLQSDEYWRWTARASTTESDEEFLVRLRDAFLDAIAVRTGDATQPSVALLSGGLDSRTVVAALRHLGRNIHTISYGPIGSLDRELAQRVAVKLGSRHFELGRGVASFWARMRDAHAAWLAQHGSGTPSDHQLWSGEGGDRVLAPVNLSPDVVAAMRRGDTRKAVEMYLRLEGVGLPRRAFSKAAWRKMRSLPHANVARIVDAQDSTDPARRFHLYVLTQEARRNIASHFEDHDLRRFEYIMPFYDSKLIATALTRPLDPFLRHALYVEWIKIMPGGIHQVPWQAYPSAVPCPLPIPPGFRTQWQGWYTPEEQKTYLRERRELASFIVNHAQFPDRILNRWVLRAAHFLLRCGIDQYHYLFSAAEPFVRAPPASDAVAEP
jgi:asparagine synthase (glutamine-hydrolysing)